MISINRRVIPGTRTNATRFPQTLRGSLPEQEFRGIAEEDKTEDIIFVPPDMMHSRDLDAADYEPVPPRSTPPPLSQDQLIPITDVNNGSEFFSYMMEEEPETDRPHGIFRRKSKMPKKSYWRIIADLKNETRQGRTEENQPIEPAILESLVSRHHSSENMEFGKNETGSSWTDFDDLLNERSISGRDIKRRSMVPDTEDGLHQGSVTKEKGPGSGRHPPADDIDEVTRFLVSRGVLKVKDERFENIEKERNPQPPDIIHLIPDEYRDYLKKMLDPGERKKMLGEIYKTRVFVACYWMFGILLVLLLLPESRFYAPFIAGYIGGRKAGSVSKGVLAALFPFMLLGIIEILISYNIIYHFYDIYLPAAGHLSHDLSLLLSNVGMDTTGLEGAFYNPGTSLGRTCLYMMVSAILGGTLESDARRLSSRTADWVKMSSVTSPFHKDSP